MERRAGKGPCWRTLRRREGVAEADAADRPHPVDEEIVAELQRVAAVLGTTTLTQADVLKHSPMLGAKVLRSRFGSFTAALAAAGLRQSPMANRWTDQEYVDNLRLVWSHLGRAPIRADMNRPPSRITGDSYRNKFGSWEKALAAAGQP